VAAVEPQPEDFAARVRTVQARLSTSVARAGLTNDAYAHIINALSATLDVLVDFHRTQQTQATLTDAQVDDIGQRLIGGCRAWSLRLARSSDLRSRSLQATAAVGILVVGIGIGWRLFSTPAVTCAPQANGGIFCGYWQVEPPTGKP
jgi:hypothetical protein